MTIAALTDALRVSVGIRQVGSVAWDDLDGLAAAILAALRGQGWDIGPAWAIAVGEALRLPTDGTEAVAVHVSDMTEARYWRLGQGWSDWHCWSGGVAATIAAARACLDARCDDCRAVDRASGREALEGRDEAR